MPQRVLIGKKLVVVPREVEAAGGKTVEEWVKKQTKPAPKAKGSN